MLEAKLWRLRRIWWHQKAGMGEMAHKKIGWHSHVYSLLLLLCVVC